MRESCGNHLYNQVRSINLSSLKLPEWRRCRLERLRAAAGHKAESPRLDTVVVSARFYSSSLCSNLYGSQLHIAASELALAQNCCTIGEGDALSVVLDETRRIAQDNGICLATLSAAAFKT